jgi:hypothetical protein
MYVKKAERLQIELLDEYLQELGYPDHWKKFIEEEKRKEYLIIKSKNKCHCLCCNEEFQSNAKVNEYITCPHCNLKLKIKSNLLKKYESRKDLILIQKYNQNYVFRVFELYTWLEKCKMKFSLTEWGRKIEDSNFKLINFYVSNNLKSNMGNLFVAHYEKTESWKPYFYNWLFNISGKYYYYNFKELFYHINKYSMIWDLAKNVDILNFHEVSYDSLILKKNTSEILIKAGLYNLANDCQKYRKKGTFEQIFSVDRGYLSFMIENNITSSELEILSKFKIKNINLIRYLDKFHAYDLDKILYYCKPLDLYKYKLNPDKSSEYLDYLKFAKELGFDIKDKKYLYPKNLKKKHDEYMQQIETNKNKKTDRKIKSKYKKLLKNKYENKKYIIIPASSISALVDESKQQNNCVRTYAERIAKNECDIYFMRLIGSQDKSLVTVEVRNNRIVQKRTKNNSITTNDQNKFLDLWERKVLNA